jgi:hypothetical protein
VRARYGVERPAAAGTPLARVIFREEPLGMGWVHCGPTAEFFGTLIAGVAGKSGHDANEVRHSVSYLANELLENAVKFRARGTGDVRLEVRFDRSTFELVLSNFTEEKAASGLRAFLADLETRDPGELLMERIEANAADESNMGSGLGILTLLNDYGVRLGWTLEQEAPGSVVHVEIYAGLTFSQANT